MSSKISSGRKASATSSACRPSCAARVSWPMIFNIIERHVAEASLSSPMRTRYLAEVEEAAYQAEPDPEATLRALRGLMTLREDIEYLRQHVRGDPDTVVAYLDHRIGALALDGELYMAARLGVLGAVVEEIHDHLAQAHAIGINDHGSRRRRDREPMARCL